MLESKTGKSGQRKIFIAATATNEGKKPMELGRLNFKLSLNRVKLLDYPVVSLPLNLAPNKSRTIQASTFVDREILIAWIRKELTVSGDASP